jgi:predicted RNA-binding protein with PIN domain
MPYLIDGHNLIGSMPGLSLADPEDERKLLELLLGYAHRARRRMIVFFDKGNPIYRNPTGEGLVTARFVPRPKKADDAIIEFLRDRRDAPNYTVVTSDLAVRRSAQRAGAKVVSSADFAARFAVPRSAPKNENPPEPTEDLEDWLKLFKDK